MRDIPFRAWHKTEKAMGYLNLSEILSSFSTGPDNYPDGLIFYTYPNGSSQYAFTANDMKDVVIMLATGLTDKNGKVIYEGDRVVVYDKKEKVGIERDVEWVLGIGAWSIAAFMIFPDGVEFEVVGNLYENPA